MRLWWVLVFTFSISVVSAQLNDVQWVLGYNTSVLDFRNDTVTNYAIQPFIGFFLTSANICDEGGNLLCFTNGISVFDKNGNLLQNGDSLSPCPHTYEEWQDGMDIPQGALFLPAPGDSNHYYLFHFSDDTLNESRPSVLYYSIIDRQGNGGLGSVIEKNHVFYHGVIYRDGGMTACKHANGRDWWIVMGGTGSNRYSVFLLTPDGISDTLTQYIGPVYNGPNDIAYSKFSMDGTKYVTVDYEGYVTVMDFDRCSGRFSNPVTIYNNASTDPVHFPMSGGAAVEFSPNGRFIYVSDVINMNQYDLQASNVQDSVQIYVADSTDLAQIDKIQVAPNGKIYGCTWNGGYYFLHVINYPDELGVSCGYVDTGIVTLTVSTWNLPNMVNYKLGPLTGSGCDTITGLSQTLSKGEGLRVQPNPADKYLYVEMPMQGDYELELVNETGQVVAKKQTRQVDIFDTENLPAGVYFVKAINKQNSYSSVAQKVVVVH